VLRQFGSDLKELAWAADFGGYTTRLFGDNMLVLFD
jgi:hypothetical protein